MWILQWFLKACQQRLASERVVGYSVQIDGNNHDVHFNVRNYRCFNPDVIIKRSYAQVGESSGLVTKSKGGAAEEKHLGKGEVDDEERVGPRKLM